MGELRIYNTLSRKKEVFEPMTPGRVGMYVCGVTVYSYCHLGHGRCYVAFDAIYRYLKYLGYEVTYIQNITDLDDKIIRQANEEGGEGDIKSRVVGIADKYTRTYFEDMDRLNVLRATAYPRATDNIKEMQEIISRLIEKGHAYQRRGNVYFEVAKFRGYGDLARKNLEELKAGARVKVDEEKKSPLDFALWKEGNPGDPTWPSPWGEGRPGWHIECSAMSMKELGPTFDIHGGGQDLIFPHHENERAQSEASSGKRFVRYWLHNGFVTINREKMSKSLGNVFNLRDIFKVYEPRVVRFFLLSQHYRSPVDYSEAALMEAKNALVRLDECYSEALNTLQDLDKTEPDETAMKSFREAMNDDFNTAAAFAVVYNLVNNFYRQKDSSPRHDELRAKINAMVKICDILGLKLKQIKYEPPAKESEIDLSRLGIKSGAGKMRMVELARHPEIIEELLSKQDLSKEEILALVMARQALRDQKDWDTADKIRVNLKLRGIGIRDNKKATSAVVYYKEDLKPLIRKEDE